MVNILRETFICLASFLPLGCIAECERDALMVALSFPSIELRNSVVRVSFEIRGQVHEDPNRTCDDLLNHLEVPGRPDFEWHIQLAGPQPILPEGPFSLNDCGFGTTIFALADVDQSEPFELEGCSLIGRSVGEEPARSLVIPVTVNK